MPTPVASRCSRYSASVVHDTPNLRSPWFVRIADFMSSLSGPIDVPSPKISSVTPCLMSLIARRSTSNVRVAQLSMLMNPGATAMPFASMTCAAVPLTSRPTATMLSPWIATSPTNGRPPVPS